MSGTSQASIRTVHGFAKRYVYSQWGWYGCGLIALAATNIITLEIPQLAKQAVNSVVEHGRSDFQQIGLWIMGLGLLQMIIRSMSRILIFWPGRKLETQSKTDLFGKTLRVPQMTIFKFGLGDLISRIANDVGHLRVFFAFGMLQVLNLGFLVFFSVAKMYSIHKTLTILCLLPLSLMLIVFRVVMPKLQTFSLANQAALGRLTTRVTEAFVNVHVIQANTAENAFIEKAEVENAEVFRTNMKVVFMRMVAFPLMSCLAGLSQLVILFYGAREVIAHRLTVGDIMAFNVYIGSLAFPLSALGIIAAVYQRAKTALIRLADIDEAQVEGLEAGAIPAAATQTDIVLELRNLNFQYPLRMVKEGEKKPATESVPFALRDIHLQIKTGERVGLIGPIGCGKSTLFQLITRLIEPPVNTILYRGDDVTTLEPHLLRKQVGLCLQTAQLFSETIRENLRFGIDGNPTQAELDAAVKSACFFEEIQSLPAGWETQIGEKGLRLSGGQKQRLALARLFLRHPQCYLLDDVLSAVDQTTEQMLISEIHKTSAAMLLASHRPSALKECHSIIVMMDGRIVDRGSFADISRRHPHLMVQG